MGKNPHSEPVTGPSGRTGTRAGRIWPRDSQPQNTPLCTVTNAAPQTLKAAQNGGSGLPGLPGPWSPEVMAHAAWSRGGQAQYLGDYVAERLRGPDLVIGCCAQQRLDRPQVIQDALQLAG